MSATLSAKHLTSQPRQTTASVIAMVMALRGGLATIMITMTSATTMVDEIVARRRWGNEENTLVLWRRPRLHSI